MARIVLTKKRPNTGMALMRPAKRAVQAPILDFNADNFIEVLLPEPVSFMDEAKSASKENFPPISPLQDTPIDDPMDDDPMEISSSLPTPHQQALPVAPMEISPPLPMPYQQDIAGGKSKNDYMEEIRLIYRKKVQANIQKALAVLDENQFFAGNNEEMAATFTLLNQILKLPCFRAILPMEIVGGFVVLKQLNSFTADFFAEYISNANTASAYGLPLFLTAIRPTSIRKILDINMLQLIKEIWIEKKIYPSVVRDYLLVLDRKINTHENIKDLIGYLQLREGGLFLQNATFLDFHGFVKKLISCCYKGKKTDFIIKELEQIPNPNIILLLKIVDRRLTYFSDAKLRKIMGLSLENLTTLSSLTILLCNDLGMDPGEWMPRLIAACHDREALLTLDRQYRPRPGALDTAAQSTHTASVHKSVSESIAKLARRYEKSCSKNHIMESMQQIEDWLNAVSLDILPEEANKEWSAAQRIQKRTQSLQQFKERLEAAQRFIVRFRQTPLISSEFVDPASQISSDHCLALVWHALHDMNVCSDSLLINRQIQFIIALYEAQRNYNLILQKETVNDEVIDVLIDNMLPDVPACASGTFNKIVQSVDRVHPDVCIIAITKEGARGKFPKIVQEKVQQYLQNLPKPQAYKIAKLIQNEGIECIWDDIKEAILDSFFEEYGSLFQNNREHPIVMELCDQGIWINIDHLLQPFLDNPLTASPGTNPYAFYATTVTTTSTRDAVDSLSMGSPH